MNAREYFSIKLSTETDAWDLREEMAASGDLELLDVRSLEAFSKRHIAGSRSFPHKIITPEGVECLDRSKRYVVYCDGLGCNAATNAAFKLSGLGFDVRELSGGLDWWQSHGYPIESGTGAIAIESASCSCS